MAIYHNYLINDKNFGILTKAANKAMKLYLPEHS